MTQIRVLEQDTIDKIAAGEVIERPSSIVKELTENAIDAGANAITVEIREGGISFIRITDNGEGIDKSQVSSAFLRHATSKIRCVEDLQHIGSLGFRGEALSSIAAVSQVELITKTAGNLDRRSVSDRGRQGKRTGRDWSAGRKHISDPECILQHAGTAWEVSEDSAADGGRAHVGRSGGDDLALSHPGDFHPHLSRIIGQTRLHTSGNRNLTGYHLRRSTGGISLQT